MNAKVCLDIFSAEFDGRKTCSVEGKRIVLCFVSLLQTIEKVTTKRGERNLRNLRLNCVSLCSVFINVLKLNIK